jgi:cyclophilin family peptidyl-prolyl cis-trans isomerase
MKFGRVRQNYFKAFWIYVIALLLLGLTFHSEAKDSKPKVDKEPVVVMSTSMGDITIKLNGEKAPISTQNFLAYVEKKQYDGTIFHRVIKDFMIQGGGFTPDMKEKPTMAPIKNEAKNGLSNKRGTIAMARTGVVDSATAQFFINVVDNTKLDYKSDADYGYAVFGEVTSGMDVVDKIRYVTTVTKGDYADVPAQTVLIKSIRLGKK